MDIHFLPKSKFFIGILYQQRIQCTLLKDDGLTTFQAASPLSFTDLMFFLMHRCRNLLWAHYPVVDPHIVNHAGEVGSGFHGLTTAEI